MKTIKIFLASSEELENDRMAFGNLVRRLDNIYEKRGIRVKLFEWEDYDAAYNGRSKEGEYDEQVKASDLFLALFHTKAGEFTVHEFDVATEEYLQKAAPKVYVYCKDLQPGEEESQELKDFKDRLFKELGHFWCRYGNRDTMQLHFVMQLQLVESSRMDSLKVEEGGTVTLEGLPIAHMDNLPFATGDKSYQKLSSELLALDRQIVKARLLAEKYPDDEELFDDLQSTLNRYNQLKDEFEQHKKILLNTAKRFAQFQGEQITERIIRAMKAFEIGHIHEANIILNEAEEDAKQIFNDYKSSMKVTEQKRLNVIKSIEELMLKKNTLMLDDIGSKTDRIVKVISLFAQADEMAHYVDYDKKRYEQLLYDYAITLFDYSKLYSYKTSPFEQAEKVFLRQIDLCTELYGQDSLDLAVSYNNLGHVYSWHAQYAVGISEPKKLFELLFKSKECFLKSLSIYQKSLELHCPEIYNAFVLIGQAYRTIGHNKSQIKHAEEHGFVSTDFEVGVDEYIKEDYYLMAHDYFIKSLNISKDLFGEKSKETAMIYIEIGNVYDNQGDDSKAEEFKQTGLDILERIDDEDPLYLWYLHEG